MYNNIDEVPQERQDLADQFFNFILIKRTVVLTPITMRGTNYEQWGKPEQYENLMEALKAAKKYLTKNDNWYSVILDDCGPDDDPTPKKYDKSICIEEKTNDLPF